MSYSFPKSARLRRRREFEKVGRHGTRIVGTKLIIECLTTQSDKTRLGVTVTKKFGKAHDRNRFKRCVKEAFRQSLSLLPKGILINIRPRMKTIVSDTVSFQTELLRLLNKSSQ